MYEGQQMTLLKRICLALILSLFASNVYSAQLLGYPENKIMGFRGLDTSSSAPLLVDSRAREIKNVKLSDALDLIKRPGFNIINDTLGTPSGSTFSTPAVTGLYDAQFSDGTSKILAFVGDKLKYDNATIWVDASINSGTITAGQDYQWQCFMALDTAVCTNDEDAPAKISNFPRFDTLDTGDLTDSLDKAKTGIWYKNYLVFGNTVEAAVEKPTRFRWSNVGTVETWTDADYVDIGELSGDELVSLVELYGDLYAFLKKSIHKISYVGGDDIFIVNKIIENIGAVARDSVQTVTLTDNRRAVIFLSEERRVYIYDGASLVDIGARIQPTLDDLNPARIKYAVSSFDGSSYYLCVSNGSSATNDKMFEFNTEIGEWTVHDDLNANAMARVKTSAAIVKTYFGNYDAFVMWMDDPDLYNDENGVNGVIEDTGLLSIVANDALYSSPFTYTNVVGFIDTTPGFGSESYTGCIMKITSGTGFGQEAVILLNTDTMLIVKADFSTPLDSTSNYVIGAIDAKYVTKWYDQGLSSTRKSFKKLYFWAQEESSNEIKISYAEDFSSNLGSEIVDLGPSSSALWGSAIWDESLWGTTGDKFYSINLKGNARMISYTFENDDIDESFKIYGYHQLSERLSVQ